MTPPSGRFAVDDRGDIANSTRSPRRPARRVPGSSTRRDAHLAGVTQVLNTIHRPYEYQYKKIYLLEGVCQVFVTRHR